MKFIRPCPNCKVELRFPIDLGTVRVTCPNCTYQFLADPDNSDLYNEGSFDLSSKKNSNFQFKLPNFSSNQEVLIKFLIPFILFLFLFLNIFKDCSPQSNFEIKPPNEILPKEEKKQEKSELNEI